MKIYKLVFRIIQPLSDLQMGTQFCTPSVLSEVEKYAQTEDALHVIENDLRDKAAALGFKRNAIVVIKTVLEVV